MEFSSRQAKFDFHQNEMNLYRRRIAFEILNIKLIETSHNQLNLVDEEEDDNDFGLSILFENQEEEVNISADNMYKHIKQETFSIVPRRSKRIESLKKTKETIEKVFIVNFRIIIKQIKYKY